MSARHTTTLSLIAAALVLAGVPAQAQWVQQNEQFYLEAKHNWQFRNRYQAADRLFNAFDYGHAILYEKLWTKPGAPPSILETDEFDRLTTRILVRPPRVPLEEAAIEVAYVKLAPEAKLMFEWAHVLHRQIYDVLADERLTMAQKDAEVARVLAYYKTRPDLAFSSRPKTMELMQEQPYSLAFRKNYPKFNGLIWGYHWLQIGLYEPLLVGTSPAEKQSLVRATVSRFWQMVAKPVDGMPHQMPMTAAVAPKFAERYEEAAIIFDNLHSMHDVISDILANPAVPRDRKRAEILRAARLFRDDTSYVMTPAAWKAMAQHMGLENMGGPAVGFLPALPTPTVTYGAVMTHDNATGAMTGFKYGNAVGGEHAAHGATPAAAAAAKPADEHAAHHAPAAAAAGDTAGYAFHMRFMSDTVIRNRVFADSAMHHTVMNAAFRMPPAQRDSLIELMHPGATAADHTGHAAVPVTKEPAIPRAGAAKPAGTKPAATRPAARRSATKPAATKAGAKPVAKKPAPAKTAPRPAARPKPADPHAGHKMPPDPHAGHKMPPV